jgi:predicted amidohydrolase YtcJ
MSADIALMNGHFVTMNPSSPYAQAVAIRKNQIAAVGTVSEVKKWIGEETRTIDLRGRAVVPGFDDAHAHIIGLGQQSSDLDLRGVSSITSIQRRLQKRAEATEKGKWIFGRGWDQDRLKEKRYPTRWDLDKVAPDNPVFLIRVCGHVGIANSKALEQAGLDGKTSASLNEFVDKTPRTGELTGLVKEKAVDLICSIPEPTEKDLLKACTVALIKAAKVGLTSVTCITSSLREVHALQKLREQGRLPLRVYVMIPIECLGDFTNGQLDDPFLKIRCVKIFADGSLGARTAALAEPYADEPSTTGILYHNLSQLKELIKKADKAGFQIAVHAIGDQASMQVLQAFETALGKARVAEHRHRIEHASVLNPDLIKRIKVLGLLITVQPHFVVSDFWIPERLGPERTRWTYAFRSLIENGVPIAASSDAPVEPINPLLGIWAAVTRKLSPQERLSVMEALRAYTLGAAYSSFEENTKGSIEVGKYADLAVLSHDPIRVKPDSIKDIRVEMTIVGGRIVYNMGRRPYENI